MRLFELHLMVVDRAEVGLRSWFYFLATLLLLFRKPPIMSIIIFHRLLSGIGKPLY